MKKNKKFPVETKVGNIAKKLPKSCQPGNTISSDLTPTQQKILDLFIGEGLDMKGIAKRRQISIRTVRYHMKNLKKKGWISSYKPHIAKKVMPIPILARTTNQSKQPSFPLEINRFYRLHALHVIVKPYYFYRRYANVKKGFGIPYGNWTVTFNSKNVEFQTKEGYSFDSTDIDECRRKAQRELNKIINKVAAEKGFEVYKDRKVNIRLAYHHFAEVNNGVAKELEGKTLKIRGKDSKVWLLVDMSTGVPEDETVHAMHATDDRRMLEHYYNDWRYNAPPTNSELLQHLTTVAANQDVYNKNIELHLEVLQDMKATLRGIRKEMRQVPRRFLSQPSGPRQPQQSSLMQYIGCYK